MFRSRVAIFQLRPPMSSLFRSFLLLVWMFHSEVTRLSNKLLEEGYVTERLKSSLRKFFGRYRILSNNVPLPRMLNDSLWPDHIQWQPPDDQTLYPTRPFTELWEVSIVHCNGFGMLTGDAYSSGHLVPSLWELHMFYLLGPILFSELVIFPDYALRISLGTFSSLLCMHLIESLRLYWRDCAFLFCVITLLFALIYYHTHFDFICVNKASFRVITWK